MALCLLQNVVSLVLQMARSGTRKQAMSSFRAIERDEKAADRRSVDRACKAKRALETEEEAFEHTDTFLHISGKSSVQSIVQLICPI